MEFVDCVKDIVNEFGAKKVAESSFIGLLSDLRAFDDEPRSSKTILKFWESRGMLEKISNISAKGRQWKNDVSDIILQTEKEGFDRDVVSNLLHNLLLGMGIVKPALDWNKEFQSGPTSEKRTVAKRKVQKKAGFKTKTKSKQNNNSKSKEIWFVLKCFIPALLLFVIFFVFGYWDSIKGGVISSIGGRVHNENVLDVQGENFTVNGVTFKMIAVKGGKFWMGSESGGVDEKPHPRTVSDFMIGETEVTQALWEAVMEDNPSKYKRAERPVNNVSWYDCQTFIKRLNQLTGKNFRLPTEAEWEYAARGGHKSKGIYTFSGSQKATDVAWFGFRPHEVKNKLPNELGVYDMSGNVEEWCEDRYNWINGEKVLRGGSYTNGEHSCSVFHRGSGFPDRKEKTYGFRIVLSVETIDEEGEEIGTNAVIDIDGNRYNTVQIGDQVWMAENLRTTRYADGTEISIVEQGNRYNSCMLPYRYAPNKNDMKNTNSETHYGYLYNWYAVMHGESSSKTNPSGVQGICPNGWHVPSRAEWIQLVNYVSSNSENCCGGDTTKIGKALAATTGWNSSTHDIECYVGYNQTTNNTTGFSALPAGYLEASVYTLSRVAFRGFGETTSFWSASECDEVGSILKAYKIRLDYNLANVLTDNTCEKASGFSVRCVRD